MIRLFRRLTDGWHLMAQSVQVLFAHPKFLVPLLFCWIVYAPLFLYMVYLHPWELLTTTTALLSVFGAIFFLSLVLTLTCHVLLEMIQQIESDQPVSLMSALSDAVSRNLLKSLPIIVVWSILWFLLTVIDVLVSGKDDEGPDELTLEGAARTLGGDVGGFRLSRAFFRLLNKAVRMTVFLILPSIAWEDQGPVQASKRGLTALRTHIIEFATGFVSSELIALVVFLPVTILFTVVAESELVVSSTVWIIVIVYLAFAWSFSLYIEQMFAAELYLWHLMWLQASENAAEKNRQLPALSDVQRPSLLDGMPEFAS